MTYVHFVPGRSGQYRPEARAIVASYWLCIIPPVDTFATFATFAETSFLRFGRSPSGVLNGSRHSLLLLRRGLVWLLQLVQPGRHHLRFRFAVELNRCVFP